MPKASGGAERSWAALAELHVGILDEHGSPIPGYALEGCDILHFTLRTRLTETDVLASAVANRDR